MDGSLLFDPQYLPIILATDSEARPDDAFSDIGSEAPDDDPSAAPERTS
ncbi:MAG: hypothetical protein GVY25_13425 [Bacteroidetes bacterium]|jgi:hypothetical protein|nr:hypothetical protein [Bacteroidota bacterium]